MKSIITVLLCLCVPLTGAKKNKDGKLSLEELEKTKD